MFTMPHTISHTGDLTMKCSKKEILSRRQAILQFIQDQGYCENTRLAQEFHLSAATIRREIQELHQEGLLNRYHGGVRIAKPLNQGIPYEIYSKRNLAEKSAIVNYVAGRMIADRDVIFINGSSTALLIYPYLDKDITIMTNNAKALFTESRQRHLQHLVLIGGEASSHNGEYIMCGEFALNMISSVTASVSILGVSGISVSEGITSSSLQDVPINKMMLERTRGKKIVIADHSKIGKAFNFHCAQIDEITHLVTDSMADIDELLKIRRHGIHVTMVDPVKGIEIPLPEESSQLHGSLQ